MLEMAGNAQIMLEIEDYAFPFGLCFSRPIMLKIMLAYCINAYCPPPQNQKKRTKTLRDPTIITFTHFLRTLGGVSTSMGHIHLRGKWRPRTPRWYNAALTHTK